jgi:riboflavin kinase/FMN adenylyltransferase
LRQKLEIFESLGVSVIILIDFSQNFSTLRGRDFINTLIGRGNMRYLAVGSNFRCGFRLDTDAQAITGLTAEQGVETEVVPRVLPVSSSLIRQAIAAGDLTAAADALGRNFAVDLAGLLPVRRNRSAAFDLAGQGQILPPAGVYPAYIYMEGIKHISEVAVENGALLVPSRFGAPGGVEFLGPRGE